MMENWPGFTGLFRQWRQGHGRLLLILAESWKFRKILHRGAMERRCSGRSLWRLQSEVGWFIESNHSRCAKNSRIQPRKRDIVRGESSPSSGTTPICKQYKKRGDRSGKAQSEAEMPSRNQQF